MASYTSKDIEILIATMNRTSLDFLYKMFPYEKLENLSLIIVNQTDEFHLLNSTIDSIKVINSFDMGLSKSRNLAISNATKQILLIADDDVIYQKNFLKAISNSFNKNDNLDGICFQVIDDQNKFFRKYPLKKKLQLSYFEIFNCMSVEIAFKKSIGKNCKFDENFGLGSEFQLGEETIWLFDGIKKGIKFGYEPNVILQHEQITTTNKIAIDRLYFCQSVVYYRIFGSTYLVWVTLKLFFDVKQNKIKLSQIPKLFSEAIKGKKYYELYCK